MRNYVNAKFKIFSLQKRNNIALINNKKFKKIFNRNKYKSKLKLVNKFNFEKIKKKFKNNYLNSEINRENMKFVYALSKLLKINDKNLIKSIEFLKDYHIGMRYFYEEIKKFLLTIQRRRHSSLQNLL